MALDESNFSPSANVYDSVRPEYLLHQVNKAFADLGIKSDGVVADMGAGTGKLSRAVLAGTPPCQKVICIERGEQDHGMHGKCAENMASYGSRAEVRKARAEATTLPDKSVNLIVAGDAAHWFDPPEPVAKEWERILKDDGKVAIFVRYPDPAAPVVQALHGLLEKECRAYGQDAANKICDTSGTLLAKKKGQHLVAEAGSQSWQEPMAMSWTKDDLLRYLQSRSSTNTWALAEDNRTAILEKVIDPLFEQYAQNDRIAFPYIAHVMTGQVRHYEQSVAAGVNDRRANTSKAGGMV